MLALLVLGGMIAATWVQIVRAILLLGGALVLAVWVLTEFGMNPLSLFDSAAAENGAKVLAPGDKIVTGSWDAVSLGIALMFGTAGLPHILMRFYTVQDAAAARSSVNWATFFIGAFYLLTFVLGFGAMVLVGQGAITAVRRGATWRCRSSPKRSEASRSSASSPPSRSRPSWPSSRASRAAAPRTTSE
jgi:cation/acetate symporter